MLNLNNIKIDKTWYNGTGKEFDVIISSRVRLSRNLTNYSFPGVMNAEDEKKICSEVISAFKKLPEPNNFTILYLDKLKPLEKRLLLESNIISQDYSLQKGKAILLNNNGELFVVINSDDHIRISCIMSGMMLDKAYKQVNAVDENLDDHLKFAFSLEHGYLNTSLANIGTGMKISLMLHLPALVMTSLIRKALKAVAQVGLSVRGFFNDGVSSLGDIYQISSSEILGQSEKEIIKNIEKIILPLIEYERKARTEVLEKKKTNIEDKIYRALGILTHCRSISSKEAIELLSKLRLGISLGLIKDIPLDIVSSLFIILQKSHIQQLIDSSENKKEVEQIDFVRAKVIRESICKEITGGYNYV